MPAPWPEISRPGLVVCEGQDDERLLITLLNRERLDALWVEYVGGKPDFRRYVRELRTRPGFERVRALAVVRDADTDATREFDHACALFRDFRYPVPEEPGRLQRGAFPGIESGTVGSNGVTGVLILPIDQPIGALEDVFLSAIHDDPSLLCVDTLMDCVARQDGIVWPTQYVAKARLNVWLGSRSDPRRRLREAIAAEVFPLDHPVFQPIRSFLRQLAAATGAPSVPPA